MMNDIFVLQRLSNFVIQIDLLNWNRIYLKNEIY